VYGEKNSCPSLMIVCVRWLNNVFFSSSVPGSFDGELDRSALNNAVRHFFSEKIQNIYLADSAYVYMGPLAMSGPYHSD